MVWTVDGNVIYILLSLVFQILAEINHLPVGSQILMGQSVDPSWNCCREKKKLRRCRRLFLDTFKDLVNILLESHVQHLVRFVKD